MVTRVRFGSVAAALALAAVVLAGCGVASSTQATGNSGAATATTSPTNPTNPTTPSTSPSGGGPVLIVRTFSGSVSYDARKPSMIGFSADSSNVVTHLTWSAWSAAGASGTGSLELNNCQPSCAQGSVTHVAASVHLGAVVSGHFTTMTEKAGTLSRSYSYPSDWAASAS